MDRVLEIKILETCDGFYGYEPITLYNVHITIEEESDTWTETTLMILADLKGIAERNNIKAL